MRDLKSIMSKYGITKTELHKRFNIPLRTLDSWTTEGANARNCPDYVAQMLEEIIRQEHDTVLKTVYEVQVLTKKGRSIFSGETLQTTYSKAQALQTAQDYKETADASEEITINVYEIRTASESAKDLLEQYTDLNPGAEPCDIIEV